MAKNDLLREAVADAKKVKEAAIANAMLTLEEAFKPRLTSMMAAKLRNEEEKVEESQVEEQKKLDSSEIGGAGVTVKDPAPKKPSAVASSSSDIDNPKQEVEPMGEGVEGEDEEEMKEEVVTEESDDELDETLDEESGKESDEESEEDLEEELEEELDEELDLSAIIRELEDDISALKDKLGEDDEKEVDEDWQTADAGKHSGLDKDMRHEGEDEEDEDEEEGEEEEHGHEKEDSEEDEVDLEEILREMEAEEDEDEEDHVAEIAAENVELKRSLREHREVIQFLRNKLQEISMLNNKLMFTTKLFRSFDLSENQKKKIVEQFDRASTVRETKLVYTTLVESLSAKTHSKKSVNRIAESASKVVASTKPKSTTVITEGDSQVKRLQVLAGIIRD